jgi:hypothetical protein
VKIPPTGFPTSSNLIGVLASDFGRLAIAERKGLRAEDFRHKLHGDFYGFISENAAKGFSRLRVDAARLILMGEREAIAGNAGGYLAKLVRAHGAEPDTAGHENCADSVELLATRIIAGIRNTEDRATWYRQLKGACRSRGIGHSDYCVGIGIGDHVNHATGRSFPGYELLAQEWGASMRTVQRAIIKLRDQKHLHIDGGRPVTFIPILWGKLKPAAEQAGQKRTVAAEPAKLAAATERIRQSQPVETDEIPF